MKICVCALAIRDNNVLCIEDKKGRGYILPGGKVEHGETPQQAVIRETFEETGIDVWNPELIFHSPTLDGEKYTYAFLVHHAHGEPTEGDEGKPQWGYWDWLRNSKYGWWYDLVHQQNKELIDRLLY